METQVRQWYKLQQQRKPNCKELDLQRNFNLPFQKEQFSSKTTVKPREIKETGRIVLKKITKETRLQTESSVTCVSRERRVWSGQSWWLAIAYQTFPVACSATVKRKEKTQVKKNTNNIGASSRLTQTRMRALQDLLMLLLTAQRATVCSLTCGWNLSPEYGRP